LTSQVTFTEGVEKVLVAILTDGQRIKRRYYRKYQEKRRDL